MNDPKESIQRDPEQVPPLRLFLALFLMGFGYALLSFCLFRALAFTINSTAFFMLYVCVGMPLGAYLAKLRFRNPLRGLGWMMRALIVLAVLFPVLCWLVPRGPDIFAGAMLSGRVEMPTFVKYIAYEIVITCPLFILWGMAEFTGYEAALSSGKLRKAFYLIFVWALGCAHAVGSFAVPRWGWLRTVFLVPFVALLAHACLVRTRGRESLRTILSLAAAMLVWLAVGTQEERYTAAMPPRGVMRLGSALSGEDRFTGRPLSPPAESSIMAQRWGKYCHTALLRYERQGVTEVLGYYDGVMHWFIRPDRNYETSQHTLVLSLVPEGSDVCILGSGGGRQVSMALARRPGSVVAVDLVPEVFSLLKEEHPWANGNVYNSPLVETVAADGRHYVRHCGREFDFIVLPHTESIAGIIRTLFEPGQSIHTLEAFTVMKRHLRPGGVIVVMKNIDRDCRLLNSYASTLKAAGLQVVGWVKHVPDLNMQIFFLLATCGEPGFAMDAQATEFLLQNGWSFRDFQKTPPRGPVICDDSPLSMGVGGCFYRPESVRSWMIAIGAVAVLLVCAIMALTLRQYDGGPKDGRGRWAMFVLAGVAVGINAVYIENAMIFWLVRELRNSLSAFFLGAMIFLLIWGLSSLCMKRWRSLVLAGAAGAFLAHVAGPWDSPLNFTNLVLMAFGSGLFFPLLGLTFRKRLLNLFAADAVGGLVGAILGIWLPFLSGFESYFNVVPLVWLGTTGVVVVCVWKTDLGRSVASGG